MIVGHRNPKATLQFIGGTRQVVDTDVGRIVQTKKSTFITFEAIFPGIPTTKITTRGGRLLGRIDTEIEAKRLGVDASVLDQWFYDHPSWDHMMMEVSPETAEVEGDTEGLGDGITSNGEGAGYSCTVCLDEAGDPKFIQDGRGLSGHRKSKAHQDNLAARRAEMVQVA